MVRMSLFALSVSGFLTVSQEASAQELGPYMWGAGVKLGTIIVPGRYPYAFPSSIARYDFIEEGAQAGAEDGENKGRDLDADGDPRFSTLEGMRPFRLGGEGFFGINKENRIGAGLGFGLGKRFVDTWVTLNYDRVLVSENIFNVVLGGQAGYGYSRWGGDSAEPGGENEAYKIGYFPLKARIEGQFRTKEQMFGLGFFAGTAVPASTTYLDLDGNKQDTVGGPGNFALHLQFGIEAGIQFGDFTPPKAKSKGGKGKGGKGGGAKAGGGKAGGGKAGGGKAGGKAGKGGKTKGGKLSATEGEPLEVTAESLLGTGTRSGFLLLPSAGAGLLLLGVQALRRRKSA